MIKHTTIEIDDDLLNRAKKALGEATARATVEEALRRAVAGAETELEVEPRSSGATWSS
ncbi:MAG TPA: type II toxin-antitoxin system VapB family antitoxin [Thermoanaerobaculia bacterium]|jgi:Arc/MetJ family transcription regulator